MTNTDTARHKSRRWRGEEKSNRTFFSSPVFFLLWCLRSVTIKRRNNYMCESVNCIYLCVVFFWREKKGWPNVNKLERNCISNVTFDPCHYGRAEPRWARAVCGNELRPETETGSLILVFCVHICISNWWFNNIIDRLKRRPRAATEPLIGKSIILMTQTPEETAIFFSFNFFTYTHLSLWNMNI